MQIVFQVLFNFVFLNEITRVCHSEAITIIISSKWSPEGIWSDEFKLSLFLDDVEVIAFLFFAFLFYVRNGIS